MIRISLAQHRPLSSPRPLSTAPQAHSSHSGESPQKHSKPSSPHLDEEEDCETGAVSWSAYTGYIRAMGNPLWAIVIFGSLVLGQVANVANSLMLGFWSGQSMFGWGQGEYMGVYAGCGMAMAICVVSHGESNGRAKLMQ